MSSCALSPSGPLFGCGRVPVTLSPSRPHAWAGPVCAIATSRALLRAAVVPIARNALESTSISAGARGGI
eukprot:6127122-Alexandrium_andersonii.AAC.1